MGLIRRRVVISGRVQGVGFRAACGRQAMTAGVAGMVRNIDDGRVEAIFEGRPEDVDELVKWCGSGPLLASVRGLEVSDEPPTGTRRFEVLD